MKGKYSIQIQNAAVRYEFEIKRNITIIRGDSATGKTKLVEMIAEYYEEGEASGISLKCEKICSVLSGRDWKAVLSTWENRIVFIDEGNDFVLSDEFAAFIQETDNYYVIVTREGLPNLPYSVDEIYGIRESGKYASLKQVYNEMYHIYEKKNYSEPVKPEVVLVEDSNSGYEFYDYLSQDRTWQVYSANGKSNLFKLLNDYEDKEILIIADGAAFGAEMNRIMKKAMQDEKVNVYLPESFEWIILKADILQDNEIREILKQPELYIESRKYFSWERFFTAVLMDKTKDTYLRYVKRKINPSYLNENAVRKICSVMEGIDL